MLAFLLIPVLSCSLYYWMSDINKNIKICRLHGWWLLSEMCFIINSCALSKTLPHSGEDLVIFSASVEASLAVWKRLYLVATIIQDPVLMFTVRCLQKCLGQSSAPLCSWTARLGSSGSTDQWWGSSIAGVPAFTAMLRNIEPFHCITGGCVGCLRTSFNLEMETASTDLEFRVDSYYFTHLCLTFSFLWDPRVYWSFQGYAASQTLTHTHTRLQ